MAAVLTDDEVREASGGYTQPARQLRELHKRGFWRASRSILTGKVILERPHFEAVTRGEASAPKQSRPRLMPA